MMDIKFKSKTMQYLYESWYTRISVIVALLSFICGIVSYIVKSKYIKWAVIIGIILALIFFIIAYIEALDLQFQKIEQLFKGQEELKIDVNNLKINTSLLEGIDKDIAQIKEIEPLIQNAVSSIEGNINSELFDFIFIPDKKGDLGKLIIIINNNINFDNIYELTILSSDINSIKLRPEVPVNKKYNNIDMEGFNKNGIDTPYINMQFTLKRGLNIGIIKIILTREVDHLLCIEFKLRNKTADKTIIDNTSLTLEDTYTF